jgi:hypothetical protein
MKWDNKGSGSLFEIYEEPLKELTPLEICKERFKVGDYIKSAENTIGVIGKGNFRNGGGGSVFCGFNSLSLYSKTKDKYATIIKPDSPVSNNGKGLDGYKEHMLNNYSMNAPKPIVKSPEQVRHENWLGSMHAAGMIPVEHSAWEQINPSKMQVHNNSDMMISAGLALMSQSLPFNKSSLKENKIDILNEPVEIFIKRKSKFVIN